jgi:GT2 family glycosyltransferase
MAHPEAGVISPKVLFPDGITIQYAGARSINPYTGRGKRFGLMETDRGQFDYCQPTDLGHGAALMVPKKVIDNVGNWPTIYFLYYEEHDWVEQIKNAGYSIYYQGNSSIIHKEAMSTGGLHSPLKVYYMTRNRLLFMRRNSSGIKFASGVIFYVLFSAPKDFVNYLIHGQFKILGSFFKGLIWHLKHLNLKAS